MGTNRERQALEKEEAGRFDVGVWNMLESIAMDVICLGYRS